jgi:ADP-dependent NAD(P)H-hydrate dehydratase / NAD(P)H-hydrate epimerase
VRVTSAAESAALDHATIEGGVPSRALMRAAGFAAAGEIVRRYGSALARGVAVFAGSGNNGGDAYVVAAALSAAGIPVRLTEVGDPRTTDAQAERAAFLVARSAPTGAETVVIDGLLGTGSSGVPRGAIAEAIGRIAALRAAGARVVALDVPSGVDATTGVSDGAVVADLTITFGTVKRGLLIARGTCGAIVVVDIGLAGAGASTGVLVDRRWVAERVPPIPADANKGTRKRLAIVAGGPGMVGAAILASRAAHASGVGLVRLFVADANVNVVQTAAYDSLAFAWPADDPAATREIGEFAHAVLIGPGLGTSARSRAVVERVLRVWQGPTVVDADALNLYAGRLPELAAALGGRPALITPHPGEMGRLTGLTVDEVLARRFEVGADVARELKAAVLLKGVPTVISHADTVVVSATGTPILAAGGSGDLLAGIAGTLLAQTGDPLVSAGCAAWVHGTAAELAGQGRVRGVGLDDVMRALPRVWADLLAAADVSYPVVAELPAVGEAG